MESARDRPGTARCRGHGGEGPGAVPPSSLPPPQHGHLVSFEPPPARPAALHRHRALNWRPPLIKLRCEPRTRAAGSTRWGGAGCPAVCLAGCLAVCLGRISSLSLAQEKQRGAAGLLPGGAGRLRGVPREPPCRRGDPAARCAQRAGTRRCPFGFFSSSSAFLFGR